MKKILSIIFAVILVIGLVPTAVAAADAVNDVASLQAAIDAAAEGDTITLDGDIEITEETTFAMKNGVTLDLNDKTVSAKDGKAIFNGENFTIKNGTFEAIGAKDYYLLTIDSASSKALHTASNIVLEDLTVTGGGVKIRGGATVTLKDNEITANQSQFKYAVWAYGSSNVTIESGTYYGGKDGYDVFEENGADITVYAGNYKCAIIDRFLGDGAAVKVDGNAVTVATAVAQVNGNKYISLLDAVNAAQAGDTITVLKNFEITEETIYNLKDGVTLNINTKIITTKDAKITVTGKNINIKNGTIKALGAKDYYLLTIDSNGAEKSSASINAVKFEGGGLKVRGGANVIINRANIQVYQEGFQFAVWAYGSADVTINDGIYYGGKKGYDVFAEDKADITINGGEFKVKTNQEIYLADGLAFKQNEKGTYKVVKADYVAEVGGDKYETLIEAVNAAKAGETVKLLKDCTIDMAGATVTIPTDVTLDLNGKTLTIPFQKTLFEGKNITIKNGTLTTGALENYVLYLMGGSFTVENVTATNGINIHGSVVTLIDVDSTCPNKYYAVYSGDGADVTIESGKYDTVRNANNLYVDSNSSITVKGGYFTKNVFAFDNGTLTLYGGTYKIKPNVDYVAAGYKIQDNVHDTYTTYTVVVDPDYHVHSYSSDWKYDETNHWKECDCRVKANEAAHTFGDWQIANDIEYRECVCGKFETRNIDSDDADAGFLWLALLRKQKFDIDANASAGGTITPEGVTSVFYNESQTYTIEALDGYKIAGVYVDAELVGVVSEYTFEDVQDEHTIYVEFEKLPYQNPFEDISEDDWFYEDVKYVNEKGLMIGVSADAFGPEITLNRATVVTTLWRLSGSPVVEIDVEFDDLKSGEWYSDAMVWAIDNEIILGYGDGTCRPLAEITHEQLCAIFMRYADLCDIDVSVPDSVTFNAKYSDWAEENVLWAVHNDFYDTFESDISDLTKTANRAEVAVFLHVLCELIEA